MKPWHPARSPHPSRLRADRQAAGVRSVVWTTVLLAAALLQVAAIPVHFALLGNVPQSPAQEETVRNTLAAIANRADITFILDNGNIKGAQERCSDALLEDRIALLNSAPLPLVWLPGAADWVDCQQTEAGAYDPLERLDFLRESALASSESMGTAGLPLERESDFARFDHFHENTLWQQSNVLFVGLEVVGHNNHYLDAGGRNGEFEDRVIANRYWLEHALRLTRERHPAAVVIAIQGDPGLNPPSASHDPFAWLNFRLGSKRDGYLEFKQDLAKFAQQFEGPIVLIDQMRADSAPANAPAFRLLPPAHRRNGGLANRVWQLELGPHADPSRWLQVEIVAGREFSVRAVMQTTAPPPPPPPSAAASGTVNSSTVSSGEVGASTSRAAPQPISDATPASASH